MKKFILITLGFLFTFQAVSGQSKVAVLDASLGEGVHPNASAIVADTINEQFVKSAEFIAIDRAYITSIQEEKQFQLSGDVDTEDIKELGITFGAKYLCIANVSLLGNTYTVSARLIEVETAQVVLQESARLQGQIDVLFNVAEMVGSKLIGKEVAASPTPQPAETVPSVKPSQVQPVKSSTKPKTFSRTTLSYMMPAFSGTGRDLMESTLSGYDTWTYGIDVHSLMTVGNYYYFAMSGSLGFEGVYDWVLDIDSSSLTNLDLRVTAGGVFPISNILQIFGGVGLGYQHFILGDFWAVPYDSEAGAFVYGVELGGDFRINNIVISMRMQTGKSTFPAYTVFLDFEEDFGYTAFIIGAGFTY